MRGSADRSRVLAAGAILMMTAIAATAQPGPSIKSHPEGYINADGSASKDTAAPHLLKTKRDTVPISTTNMK